MATNALRITEYDGGGDNVTATYVQSQTGGSQSLSRVDAIPPVDLKSLWQKGVDVFLPVGYPHSVTDDYLEYQIYDSLQAFSSSIASLLSSRAVLSSVGVGDSSASPTAALLLSIIQESAGRIATILFAHRFGTSLEPECKMYRLLADVLNDTAFILDCLSPVFPKPVRVLILSFSSVLRALCGVAAGSSKASLSAHFARWGNLGELNAKDSSQETVISLVGMLVGSMVVSWITTPMATWATLILLLSIHLETNRRAVRAVKMRTLNRQRATLVFHHLQRGHVPSIDQIASEENIFERGGILRCRERRILGFCAVGVPVTRLLNAVSSQRTSTNAVQLEGETLTKVMSIYERCRYVLWKDKSLESSTPSLYIVLKKGIEPSEVLVAWWQALLLVDGAVSEKSISKASSDIDQELQRFKLTRDAARNLFSTYDKQLRQAGWDLNSGALETGASTRVTIEDK
ncbi:related to DUF647 domain protein [Ramularia collo-cygni]|uniref:Related to DUF647 domain protein n=1 Tax=Ramularia collo-cygni TaxID=112498 RepID=A0A2D3UW20_9PEZI|nr:related to DUF647 domain protein [Ramularia collo-cygni]CZT20941.1 related to DUF647 domain protein [Ramularia collo-cygni]